MKVFTKSIWRVFEVDRQQLTSHFVSSYNYFLPPSFLPLCVLLADVFIMINIFHNLDIHQQAVLHTTVFLFYLPARTLVEKSFHVISTDENIYHAMSCSFTILCLSLCHSRMRRWPCNIHSVGEIINNALVDEFCFSSSQEV